MTDRAGLPAAGADRGPGGPGDDADERLLVRVATLYHEHELTQQEVAERLHLTRWQVGRLLRRARRTGVVRIEIVHPRARSRDLERRLAERTGLADVVVVPGDPDPAVSRRLVAAAAGDYLADRAETPRTVAVSWGRTIADVAAQVPPSWADRPTIVQANGGLSRPGGADPSALAELARQAQGSALFLQAPAVVDTPGLARALTGNGSTRRVLDVARSADVLLYSPGERDAASVLVESGHLTAEEVAELAARGAVGDVLSRFLGTDGRPVDPDLDARTIGLDLDDVRRIALPVAVAAGASKVPATRVAVEHGLCRALITDEEIASQLLDTWPGDPAGPQTDGTARAPRGRSRTPEKERA